MYNDLFSIGSYTVHGYGTMIALGVVSALIIGVLRTKRNELNAKIITDIAILCIIFGFIGAKLLYIPVHFKEFVSSPLKTLGSSGFVVYGGIAAGIAAAYVYCRRRSIDFLTLFDTVAPAVASAQGFGRIGCFLAGCCYGKETDSAIGVVFPEGSCAPAGVPLIPVQLFSAAGDLLIAVILIILSRRIKKKGSAGGVYLLLYGVGRFAIEFFRADARGALFGLSTSQIISLLFFVPALYLILRKPRRAVLYVHGQGGNAGEAEHYKPLFKDCDVSGLDYVSQTPLEAKEEFPKLFDTVCAGYDGVTLIANSIGAYYSMTALADKKIDRAYFISPVCDMEKLISDMMAQEGIGEDELREKGIVGALSWDYLTFVRQNKISWNVPTFILYGENDELTAYETVSQFAETNGAKLTVMPDGEHWFHTDEQMSFLDDWIKIAEKKEI